MSYFKPLNSNENNLHIIRATIDSSANIIKPSVNQLPYNFSVQKVDSSSNVIIVNYPNIFNSTDIPSVFIESTINSINVTNKESSNCTITSSLNELPTFDIFIIGTKTNGPVFAVSNRGWKYSTNTLNNELIYSDMLVGVNTDDPTFNLTINGNLGIVPNILLSSTINGNSVLNNTLNIIQLDVSNTLQLNAPTSDGQLLHILVGSISINNTNLTIDLSSNIITSDTINIVLQNTGDSISFYSYNKNWLLYNKNISAVQQNAISYNTMNSSSYDFNIATNGYVTILNLDKTITIDLPISYNYNGYIIDMVVSDVINNSNINFVLSNITTNKNPLTLANVCDKIKLLCVGNRWLVIDG